jgi:hypothetical protein
MARPPPSARGRGRPPNSATAGPGETRRTWDRAEGDHPQDRASVTSRGLRGSPVRLAAWIRSTCPHDAAGFPRSVRCSIAPAARPRPSTLPSAAGPDRRQLPCRHPLRPPQRPRCTAAVAAAGLPQPPGRAAASPGDSSAAGTASRRGRSSRNRASRAACRTTPPRPQSSSNGWQLHCPGPRGRQPRRR